jgi:hypothetical protein
LACVLLLVGLSCKVRQPLESRRSMTAPEQPESLSRSFPYLFAPGFNVGPLVLIVDQVKNSS